MKPKEYERAVVEYLKTRWPPPRFIVKHDFKLPGAKSRSAGRQIDAGVFEAGAETPFLLAEAKRRSRSIDLTGAGATIALVRDVGSIPAIMVSTTGFSRGARNYLAEEGIGHLTLTLTEAQSLRWIPLIEQYLRLDASFREVSGQLVEALRNGDAEPFLDADIPFDEWLAVMACAQSLFPEASTKLLKRLARDHVDDGVRFNAVQLLDDVGQLSQVDVQQLLSAERDEDVVELLKACQSDSDALASVARDR